MTLSLSSSSHSNLPSPTILDPPRLFYHYLQLPLLLIAQSSFQFPSVPPPATRSPPPISSPSSPSPSFPINTLLSHHPPSSLPTPTSSLSGPSPTTPDPGMGDPSPSNFPCPSTHPGLPARPGRGGAAGPRATCSLEPVARQPTPRSPTR